MSQLGRDAPSFVCIHTEHSIFRLRVEREQRETRARSVELGSPLMAFAANTLSLSLLLLSQKKEISLSCHVFVESVADGRGTLNCALIETNKTLETMMIYTSCGDKSSSSKGGRPSC